MPWPVYTHRFLVVNIPAAWSYWTVPAGMRAVVKSVTIVNGGTSSTDGAQLRVGSTFLALHNPAAKTTAVLAMTQVAYGGEVLSGWVTGPSTFMSVSGFLFEDPAAAVSAPGDAGVIRRPENKPAGWSEPA
jgi:hypothetical protein